MENSRKFFTTHLQLVTRRNGSEKRDDSLKENENEEEEEKSLENEFKTRDFIIEKEISKDDADKSTGSEKQGDGKKDQFQSSGDTEKESGRSAGSETIKNNASNSRLQDDRSLVPSENVQPCSDIDGKELTVKKPLVKFTLSVESNSEEEAVNADLSNGRNKSADLQYHQSAFGAGRKVAEIPKESSSLPSLKLFLSNTESFSSPECGNSPEIRYSLDRIRVNSGDNSLSSTPTSRRRRQTFCGISYLSRRNLSRENAFEDSEDARSVSSSDFSPGSTVSSLGTDRFHWSDKLSDESSGDGRLRRSTDFSDDAELRSPAEHLQITPVNKQLRIVTSVDRALNPHRRSSTSSPKPDRVLNIGRSSSENLEHIAFVDFLKRLKLGQYLKHFPPNMTLLDFK